MNAAIAAVLVPRFGAQGAAIGTLVVGAGTAGGSVKSSGSVKSIGSGVAAIGRAVPGGGVPNGDESNDGSEKVAPDRGIPGGGLTAGAARGTAAIGWGATCIGTGAGVCDGGAMPSSRSLSQSSGRRTSPGMIQPVFGVEYPAIGSGVIASLIEEE